MKSGRLGTRAEARTLQVALLVGLATMVLAMLMAVSLVEVDVPLRVTAPVAVGLGAVVTLWLTAPLRRRRDALEQPFDPEWEKILLKEVVFYRALPEPDREKFRRELQVFLIEKRITGIKTEVDTTTRVLTAASAIIPIFGYPEWEWDQISEVLIYPGRFGVDFRTEGEGRSVLGMVGTGAMDRVMILSKSDLLAGFRNPSDKRNVGIHEFAHLVDKSDGEIDGIPGVGLGHSEVGPWVDLMRRKMQEIESGQSDLDRYALTNEAEFFAVVVEYLFERPGLMQKKHPELFRALQGIFEQDLRSRLADLARERLYKPKKLGRNSPCPCGSGQKFKRCCLNDR